MAEENEILKKLVVEEKDSIKEMEKLVEEAARFFKIEKPSGRIMFQNFGALTDQQRISIIMLGKYFASKLKIIDNPMLSISDISKELGRPMTTLSRPMKELIDRGLIEKLPGRKYRVAYHRINEILANISAAKQKK